MANEIQINCTSCLGNDDFRVFVLRQRVSIGARNFLIAELNVQSISVLSVTTARLEPLDRMAFGAEVRGMAAISAQVHSYPRLEDQPTSVTHVFYFALLRTIPTKTRLKWRERSTEKRRVGWSRTGSESRHRRSATTV
jgi:hypothetical protein